MVPVDFNLNLEKYIIVQVNLTTLGPACNEHFKFTKTCLLRVVLLVTKL